MNKTIEEAAKSIAKDFIIKNKNCINNDAPLTHECVQYAIDRIFAMPLIDRLTDEESEKIKAKHNACRIAQTECDCLDYEIAADMLEEIFGKELFGER